MATDPRRMITALAICAAATAGELVGGGLTHSLALTADGLHSLIHVGALLVALWGALAPGGEPDTPSETASINALVVIALSVVLGVESLARIGAPEPVMYGPAILLTVFGLGANLATVVALGRGRHDDLNHRAALLHMVGDAAVAVLAIIGLSAGWLFGWAWADPAAGLAGAVVLVLIGVRLLRRTLGGSVSPTASDRS